MQCSPLSNGKSRIKILWTIVALHLTIQEKVRQHHGQLDEIYSATAIINKQAEEIVLRNAFTTVQAFFSQ